MSDIFDDVDKILSDESDSTEVVAATEDESGFNESELQDIMSEIENLEKDFEDVPTSKATAPSITKTKLQEEIDREMEASAEAAILETTKQEASVLSFSQNKKSAAAPVVAQTTSGNEVAFSANGQMSLNLDFKVGEQCAKLCIDPQKGLVVTLSGVELCINEDSGCVVSMDNGMKFTIPLAVAENTSKKKAI